MAREFQCYVHPGKPRDDAILSEVGAQGTRVVDIGSIVIYSTIEYNHCQHYIRKT